MFQKVKSNIDISFKEKFLLPNGCVWSLPVIPTLTMKITATLDTKAIVKIVYITYKYHPVDKGTLFISMKMLLAPKGPETSCIFDHSYTFSNFFGPFTHITLSIIYERKDAHKTFL